MPTKYAKRLTVVGSHMRQDLGKSFGCVPVTAGVLRHALSRLKAPQSNIMQRERRGEVVSLRRNLYLCTPEDYSRELIANHMLAPSYVSYETVLSMCGVIPERVHIVRSSCLVRGRVFENSTGKYEYVRVPRAYYPEGVTICRTPQGYAYLAARPEKAICDLILASPGLRIQSARMARSYLEEYLRADMESVAGWDADLIHRLAELTDKKKNDLFHLERMLRHECL